MQYKDIFCNFGSCPLNHVARFASQTFANTCPVRKQSGVFFSLDPVYVNFLKNKENGPFGNNFISSLTVGVEIT